MGLVPVEIFAGGGQAKYILIVGGFANEKVKELRSLIPPMAEQLGVERRDDQGWLAQNACDLLDLRDPLTQEMGRMSVRYLECRLTIVDFLCPGLAGDLMIFDSGETALFRRRQMGPEIIEIEIESDITIEVTVARVAGIAAVPTPDLPG